jgi:hypothetical protein
MYSKIAFRNWPSAVENGDVYALCQPLRGLDMSATTFSVDTHVVVIREHDFVHNGGRAKRVQSLITEQD